MDRLQLMAATQGGPPTVIMTEPAGGSPAELFAVMPQGLPDGQRERWLERAERVVELWNSQP